MSAQEVSGTRRIEAPAEEVYDLVSDVVRMGEWSPENDGGKWLDGASAPAVGARFRGSNRRGWRRWSTTCTVVAADPGRTFAFEVVAGPVPVSRWAYDFRSDGDGTIVTETWTDRRPGLFAAVIGPLTGVTDLRAHHTKNIQTTLANLAAAAEHPGQ